VPYKDKDKDVERKRRSYADDHAKNLAWRKKYRDKVNADPGKRAAMLDRNKARNKELRDIALAMYGSKCECCGEKERPFLAFDHINGGGGVQRRTMRSGSTVHSKWLVALGKPRPDIRILCHNCNFAYHFLGDCPHNGAV
jgi:hypothetical protein